MNLVFRVIAIAMILSISALAPKAQANRVALVIGIGKYENAPDLDNPSRDATAIADVLQTAGFDVMLSVDPDQQQLGNDLLGFFDKTQDADVALFYFAGHGIQIETKNFLLSKSAQVLNPLLIDQDGFELGKILEAMTRQAKLSIAIVDACRDNPLADALLENTTSASRSAWGLARGLAPMNINFANSLVAFATAPGHVAYDGPSNEHSPFTEALLSHLPTPEVEISVMLKRVTAAVRASTDERQRPEVVTSMSQEFYFIDRAEVNSTTPYERADRLLDLALELPARKDQISALNGVIESYPGSPASRRAENLLAIFKNVQSETPSSSKPETESRDQERAQPSVQTLSKDQISVVQRELQRLGLFLSTVDGNWGQKSQTALKEAQRKLGTEPTGEISDGFELLTLLSVLESPPECFVSFNVLPGKLREEPGVLAAKLATVPMAKEFRVLEQKDVLGTQWFKIFVDDRFGWVMDFNFLAAAGPDCRG